MRGAIDPETGVYVDKNTSIYTEDLIECQGLVVEPDFEATGKFQVFYYGEYKSFVGATEEMRSEDGAYIRGEDFPTAKYCRIVITPDVPVDDDGKVEDDFKINFWEVYSFANDYTIKVDKKQSYTAVNLFNNDNVVKGKIWKYDSSTAYSLIDSEYDHIFVDITGIKEIKLEYENSTERFSYIFVDSENNAVSGGMLVPGQLEALIDVPADSVRFGVIFRTENIPGIYAVA